MIDKIIVAAVWCTAHLSNDNNYTSEVFNKWVDECKMDFTLCMATLQTSWPKPTDAQVFDCMKEKEKDK